MTRMRSLVAMPLIALLGLGAGTALRHTDWALGRTAPVPETPYTPARTRPLSGLLPPDLTRELLRAGSDSAVVVAVHARDVRTCEDLGRQIRQLASAVGSTTRLVIAIPADDSVRLLEFVRVERIRNVELAVITVPLKMNGIDVPTPAAFVLGRDGQVRRGIAHVQRERNVRTVSFAQELGYLSTRLVPPQVDSSLQRKGS
jgi:hypothetical protein